MRKMPICRLVRDQAGASAIEFALICPVIILMFLGGFTVFSLFRAYQQMATASDIVADMITRQEAVDTTWLANLYAISSSLQANPGNPHALRVTSIGASQGATHVLWSQQEGEVDLLAAQTVTEAAMPIIAEGDSVMRVDIASDYQLFLAIGGLSHITLKRSVFVRPRFVAQITYQ